MSKVLIIDRSYLQRPSFPYTFPIDFNITETVDITSRRAVVRIIGASAGRAAFVSGIPQSFNRVRIL